MGRGVGVYRGRGVAWSESVLCLKATHMECIGLHLHLLHLHKRRSFLLHHLRDGGGVEWWVVVTIVTVVVAMVIA